MSAGHPVARRSELEAIIARHAAAIVDRVELLDEVGSTQDASFDLAAGRPGLLVIADRQSAGRGRLGRSWVQHAGSGVAATFVLDAKVYSPGRLSLAAGLAAARSIDGRARTFREFGLRWPNDVVEPVPRQGGGRKVAGVLIEVRSGLALVGIGLNVLQVESEFPPELRNSAVSLRQLGSAAERSDVAASLLEAMLASLKEVAADSVREWRRRDVLTGSEQEFIHDHRRVRGIVESIDPTHEIVVRTGSGSFVRLPAATTSLVHQ